MTEGEQRIAIAQACGWKPPRRTFSTAKNMYVDVLPPDYVNDLNAMRSAERTIRTTTQWPDYVQHLSTICGQWEVVHATAAQRAEAFLKTLGLWK